MKLTFKLFFIMFFIIFLDESYLKADSRNPFLAPSEPNFEEVSNFVIKAIASSNGIHSAIIASPSEVRIVRIGDRVKNYEVKSITNSLLILEKNEREQIIYFNDSATLK